MPSSVTSLRRLAAISVPRAGWLMLALVLVSSEAPAQLLVPIGSIWKYLDDGSDQGTAWREAAFDDDAWPSGQAQLGYGDNDETTVIHGGSSNNRYVTTYFRHRFTVADAAAVTNLAVRLLRDDGAIVYLNGAEVARDSMPPEPVTAYTLADVAWDAPEERLYFTHPISPGPLVSGVNLLAVEIHQGRRDSSDVSFDLDLLANSPLANLPPRVRMDSPTNGAVVVLGNSIHLGTTAADLDGAIAQTELHESDTLLAVTTNAEIDLVFTPSAPGVYGFFGRAVDRAGAAANSPTSFVAVVEPGFEVAFFPEFGPEHGFHILENAASTRRVLLLNPPFGGRGSAWLPRKVYVREGFETRFQFLIASIVNGGADGLAFVIHNGDEPRQGVGSGSIGYGGLTNSLAVEFDTRDNPEEGDPDSNHIGVHTRGVSANDAHEDAALGRTSSIPNLTDSQVHTVRVRYASGVLTIYLDDLEMPVLTLGVNLETLLQLDHGRAWLGFAASTGSGRETHEVQNWLLTARPAPVGVTLSDPPPASVWVNPADMVLRTETFALTGSARAVEFFQNGVKLGEDRAPPFSFLWDVVPAGEYELTAVVIDSLGRQSGSDTARVFVDRNAGPITLVPRGAAWRYLDHGTDPGASWHKLAFDDSSWSLGYAPLGLGDGDEATTVEGGRADNRHVTAYFRLRFTPPAAAMLRRLALRVLHDDGAVVYLNGAEVFRGRMPAGPVGFRTLATDTASGDDESSNYYLANLAPAFLVPGENLLAVEIHQSELTSTDISFDLELLADIEPPRLVPFGFTEDGEFYLEFDSISNRTYRVQRTMDFVTWLNLDPRLVGSGGRVRWTDSESPLMAAPPSAPASRFYRVIVPE